MAYSGSLRAWRSVRSCRGPSVMCSSRNLHITPRLQQHFHDADSKVFKTAISAKDRVVLVDFYANWCGPCKMLSPVLEDVTSSDTLKTGSGKPVDLVTVDVDTEIELAQEYNIRSLPTVVVSIMASR